jgi:hypothetical protein
MPMQIGLDELLSMVLARMDGMAAESENGKTRFNVLARALYKKGILTDQDIVSSVEEEYKLLKGLDLIDSDPPKEAVQSLADSILWWIKGDAKAIKQEMEAYEQRLQAAMTQQAKRPKLDVAPAGVLDQLDRMSGKRPTGPGKKIIL